MLAYAKHPQAEGCSGLGFLQAEPYAAQLLELSNSPSLQVVNSRALVSMVATRTPGL
jgi:hypothetical protein